MNRKIIILEMVSAIFLFTFSLSILSGFLGTIDYTLHHKNDSINIITVSLLIFCITIFCFRQLERIILKEMIKENIIYEEKSNFKKRRRIIHISSTIGSIFGGFLLFFGFLMAWNNLNLLSIIFFVSGLFVCVSSYVIVRELFHEEYLGKDLIKRKSETYLRMRRGKSYTLIFYFVLYLIFFIYLISPSFELKNIPLSWFIILIGFSVIVIIVDIIQYKKR